MADNTGTPFVGPIRARLFGLTIVLLLASLIAVSLDALNRFEADLVPEMDKKAVAVGQSLTNDIQRALDYGIPLDKLVGVNEFFNLTKDSHVEIKYLSVTDPAGKVLFSVGDAPGGMADFLRDAMQPGRSGVVGQLLVTSLLLQASGGGPMGALHVGVDQKFVQKKLEDIIFDVMIVLLVALLITFELLLFLMTTNISRPIESVHRLMGKVEVGDFRQTLEHDSRDEVGRFVNTLNGIILEVNAHYRNMEEKVNQALEDTSEAAQQLRKKLSAHFFQLHDRVHFAKDARPEEVREKSLVDVRTPMFIFIFAEELSRSFFPLYVSDLYRPVPGLTEDMVIGLPISLFMLFVAIGTPFAGIWTDRFGSRNIFLAGAILAIAGFVGTGLAPDLYHLLLWRSLTAIAYALITMSCQGYIVAMTTKDNRAQGMAVFIGAIMVAAICGTSIGGVLADRLGFRVTFFMSAALSIIAAVFVYNTFQRRQAESTQAPPKLRLVYFLQLLGNLRFAALMLFGAIPAKIILTGFLFYLTPLYLNELGNSQSEIGRGMMVYFIVMVFGTPIFARLADTFGLRFLPVLVGGLLAGGGGMLMFLWDDTLGVIFGVGLLGAGHALSTAPLISMVPSVCAREVEAMGQTTVLGVFRILERVGSVAGPFLTAFLVATLGSAHAIAALGALVLASTVLLGLFFLFAGTKPAEAAA
jgi:predicted MFS family arabinose efflux permease/HAMP domain-containing protein